MQRVCYKKNVEIFFLSQSIPTLFNSMKYHVTVTNTCFSIKSAKKLNQLKFYSKLQRFRTFVLNWKIKMSIKLRLFSLKFKIFFFKYIVNFVKRKNICSKKNFYKIYWKTQF